MQKWREQLPRILFESVLIVFSILLALGVNEWREERKQAARLTEARAAFVEEIRQNLALLQEDGYLPRRQGMWNRFTEVSRLEAPTGADVARIWSESGDTGIGPTPFRDAVWRSLSASEVMSRMPYSERFILADIYREQAGVDKWHERMFTIWSHPRADRADPAFVRDDIERTRSYLADVVAAEYRLVALYERALEEFSSVR